MHREKYNGFGEAHFFFSVGSSEYVFLFHDQYATKLSSCNNKRKICIYLNVRIVQSRVMIIEKRCSS
jgi:hypothetical protein